MSLLKLIDLIGQGASSGRRMKQGPTNWTKIKDAFGRKMTQQTGKHTFNYVALHERAGSRGNGIGMGHRNQKGKSK